MGYANDFIEKTVAEYTKKSESEIQRLFYETAQVSEDFYADYYTKTGKSYTPLEKNEYMQQLITAEIDQTKGELVNLTQSMGFAVRQADGSTAFTGIAKTYQSVLDLAQMQVATGVFDYNTAIRNAVVSLSDSGLQFVDYASGHRNRADVAVRRAVLTGVTQKHLTPTLWKSLHTQEQDLLMPNGKASGTRFRESPRNTLHLKKQRVTAEVTG
jgi:hypothetical protein